MGTALIYFGDKLLGVKIELFSGLSTFNVAWALDIFFLPFMMGMMVAWIFGRETNHSAESFRLTQGIGIIIWLCYFPPLIVRSFNYAEILYVTGAPEGTSLLPFGLWACFAVMTMVTAGMGEIIAEVIIKINRRTNQVEGIGSAPSSPIKEPEL